MEKYTYYTPINLARSILSIIPEIEVTSIVDICCGSWNLLQAGKEKYPKAIITGVDVNKKSKEYSFDDSRFEVMDGREFARREFQKNVTYDLILSNPPFGYISEDERKYNLEEMEETCYSKLINKRYECEMVQANMLLAHEDSILMFILPYTFVAGVSYQKIRRQIAIDYSVLAIVKLPFTTFRGGEINTFAIILQKGGKYNKTDIYNAVYEGRWKLDKIREIGSKETRNGNWWFIRKDLGENKIKIMRGNISSNGFDKEGQEILHCAAKKDGKWKPSKRYYDNSAFGKMVVKANKGDVLVNRIGKDAGYWSMNEVDDVAISDCLLLLKNVTEKSLDILIENSDCNGRLKIPKRGVSVSYITADDVKLLFNDVDDIRDVEGQTGTEKGSFNSAV